MTDPFAHDAFREREARQLRRRRAFWLHASIWFAVNTMLVVIWAVTGGGHPWFVYPLLGWGVGLAAHGAATFLLAPTDDVVLEREQRRLGRNGGATSS